MALAANNANLAYQTLRSGLAFRPVAFMAQTLVSQLRTRKSHNTIVAQNCQDNDR